MKVRSKSRQKAEVHRVWFLGSTELLPFYFGEIRDVNVNYLPMVSGSATNLDEFKRCAWLH